MVSASALHLLSLLGVKLFMIQPSFHGFRSGSMISSLEPLSLGLLPCTGAMLAPKSAPKPKTASWFAGRPVPAPILLGGSGYLKPISLPRSSESP